MKKPLLSIAAIALVALSAAGCTNTGSVIGSVSTEQDKRPVRDARVVLTPAGSTKEYSSQADWGGNYRIHVKEGEYLIAAEHPGFVVCKGGPQTIQVVGNGVATVDLCLQKPEATPAVAPAAVAPASEPANPTPTAPPAETNPSSPSSSSDSVEVAPLADAPTTPSQFPPSAAPTFPPAPISQIQSQ